MENLECHENLEFHFPGLERQENFILGPGKSRKITFMFGILVTAANAKDNVQ